MNECPKENDQEDVATVRLVLDGDHNAFGTLVEKYQPAVLAMGHRLRRTTEETMDFVQDVFAKAFTHLSQFAGTGRFYSWLMRIASTTAINRAQRAVPEDSTEPEAMERLCGSSGEQEPHRLLERKTLRQDLLDAIRGLPRHLNLSVELFFVVGLRYREIEEITGTPVNTLKSNIHRARRLLQLQLRRVLPEEQLRGR
jgi:RNA polymerase sigma-70 factor (ECF subfamily)